MPIKTECEIARATAAKYTREAAAMQVLVDLYMKEGDNCGTIQRGGYSFAGAKDRLVYCRTQAHRYAAEADRMDSEAKAFALAEYQRRVTPI